MQFLKNLSTKLSKLNPYDYLWDRWYLKTRALASQNPEWIALNGSVDGPRPWEEWQRLRDIEHRLCPRPWYLALMEHIKRFFGHYYTVRNDIWTKWGRMHRGWGMTDMWDADNHISSVIAGMCRELARIAHGWDPSLNTNESMWDDDGIDHMDEWRGILIEIAEGFEANLKMANLEVDVSEFPALEAKFNRALELYGKHHGAIWD